MFIEMAFYRQIGVFLKQRKKIKSLLFKFSWFSTPTKEKNVRAWEKGLGGRGRGGGGEWLMPKNGGGGGLASVELGGPGKRQFGTGCNSRARIMFTYLIIKWAGSPVRQKMPGADLLIGDGAVGVPLQVRLVVLLRVDVGPHLLHHRLRTQQHLYQPAPHLYCGQASFRFPPGSDFLFNTDPDTDPGPTKKVGRVKNRNI